MDTPILEVHNLRKYFPIKGGLFFKTLGHCKAIDDVSLELSSNETLGIVGESGCGKSTLSKVITGLHEPTSGVVNFDGEDITSFSRSQKKNYRRSLQMVFQNPAESLNSHHTAQYILEEPFIINRIGDRAFRKKRVLELLDSVGLSGNVLSKYPYEFSGGQKQRLCFARSIALSPKVVICDEPVSALDVSIQGQIVNLLLDLQKQNGLSYLFIAHNINIVHHVSDRIATMYLGKIVEVGSSDAVYKNPKHPYTKALINSIPIADPDKKNRFECIKNETASAINVPSGCPFRTRCPYVQDVCKEKLPLLRTINNGSADHKVACHFDIED